MEKQIVDLYATVTFGAVGAPTLDAPNSKGIASITRTGTGAYDVQLQDTYVRFMMALQVFTGQDPAAPEMYVVSETVNSLGSPIISIQFNSSTATPEDPASGDAVRLQFSLKNSTAF